MYKWKENYVSTKKMYLLSPNLPYNMRPTIPENKGSN